MDIFNIIKYYTIDPSKNPGLVKDVRVYACARCVGPQIINYSIMALIQLEKGVVEQPDLDAEQAAALYDQYAKATKQLMEDKNHDYGEAWRDMRVSSLTDLILQKLLRVKQIEDNEGVTLVSEGIGANYQDMINYAVFALILLNEASE